MGSALVEANIYPKPIEIIDKADANYLTPENTLSAIRSCLKAEDLDWCNKTMTNQSLQEDIDIFQKAGKDRREIFELEKNVKESLITNRLNFKGAILLIVEDLDNDGSVTQTPIPFVQEDGLWKMTNKYSADEELHQYLYYAPPLFGGKGQKSGDVNSFLGYEQPTQVQTELPANTTQYRVHLYYAKTVDPATFTAELNKQDITTQFSPKPFTDEEVEIPLPRGRNTLVLSIEGTRKDGKKARDTDRLVFIVP
jgi:hypothetical protein